MKSLSYGEIRTQLISGKISCVSLVNNYLLAIEKNRHLNAFIEVFEKSALQTAAQTDATIKAGKPGRLAGCVIAIKDNICYKAHKVSASSHMLNGFESLFTATCLQRLLNEGAIVIGRTNCDEFAMGSSNETSYYGDVKNPHNIKTVPGGSSGGSCVAVAAGLCTAALGTDTGGSIRQPSSFCGTVGFKPTYGRISRYGLIAYASSFDQAGPITQNVEDAALIAEIMAGHDEMDSTSSKKPVASYAEFSHAKKPLKIAYIKECLENPAMDKEIKEQVYALCEKLKTLGHTVEPVAFPYLDYMVPTYYVLTTAEASSNLARYDGVHFGYRSKNANNPDEVYKRSRSEGFGKEVQRRIMLGTFILSAGYYDAYYARGMKARRMIRDKTLEILNQYDFILTPTTPGTAFEFGSNSTDPVKMYLEDIFTVQANLAGIPAISIPAGTHSNGLPFGIQFMGNCFAEQKLFSFAYEAEKMLV
jgi:aspartyl-tRNA(Asn)/glutamyl-tRNA(Gln) amidotransferase subunit A